MAKAKDTKPIALIPLVEVSCPTGGGIHCYACVSMCERKPCWPTPDEARRLLATGYGDQLMVDWWERTSPDGQWDPIYLLCPAKEGYEGQECGSDPAGRCVLLTEDGLCSLHEAGLKPLEGRLADCQNKANQTHDIHYAVAQTWDNPEAQDLVRAWRAAYSDRVEDNEEEEHGR